MIKAYRIPPNKEKNSFTGIMLFKQYIHRLLGDK
jgi:hypothetical protein